jgi:hypothetical protein
MKICVSYDLAIYFCHVPGETLTGELETCSCNTTCNGKDPNSPWQDEELRYRNTNNIIIDKRLCYVCTMGYYKIAKKMNHSFM